MIDFNEIDCATKEQKVRAWAVEQAVEVISAGAPGRSVMGVALEIERYVLNEPKDEMGELTHDDDTLGKVYYALRRVVFPSLSGEGHFSLDEDKVNDLILSMQNAGILFRERK